MDEVEVPSYFLCPISLDMMKDPVTIPTGITYDRESIERWMSSSPSGNCTCPVTKQPVTPDCELTPNHTLRRLIQSWCVINASKGVERIPTPKPPVSTAQVTKLIRNAAKSPQTKLDCLRSLKSMASRSNANKRCIEAAGAVEFVASVIYEASCNNGMSTPLIDEALSILYNLNISETKLRSLVDVEFVGSLTRVMGNGTDDSRAYAVMLLGKMLEAAEPAQITSQVISMNQQLFPEVVQALRDRISQRATKASLKLLIHLSLSGRNRIKVVEAGAVPVLIEFLLEHNTSSENIRVCEMALTVMDILCQTAEGRAELLGHGAGIAVLSKKILRVSQVASERAVRVLLSISRFSGTARVLDEMLQVGAATKLCLVLQVESGSKTKEKATEILRMNARTWKNSPCLPRSLLSSYPS